MNGDSYELPIPVVRVALAPPTKENGLLGGFLDGLEPGESSSAPSTTPTSSVATPGQTNALGLPKLSGVPDPLFLIGSGNDDDDDDDAPAPAPAPAPSPAASAPAPAGPAGTAAPLPAGGVALSQLTGLPTLDTVPAQCSQVLNSAIPSCQTTDFHSDADGLGQQNMCSQPCQAGLQSQLTQFKSQCSPAILPAGSMLGGLVTGGEAAILCQVAKLLGVSTSTSTTAASSTSTSAASAPPPPAAATPPAPPAPPAAAAPPPASSTSTSTTSTASQASVAAAPPPAPPASTTTALSTITTTTTPSSSLSSTSVSSTPASTVVTTVPLVLPPAQQTATLTQTTDVLRTSVVLVTATAPAASSQTALPAPPPTTSSPYNEPYAAATESDGSKPNAPSPTPITSVNAPSPVPTVLGIVFGLIAMFAIGGLFGWLFWRRQKKRSLYTDGTPRIPGQQRQYRSPVTGRTIYPYMSGLSVAPSRGDRGTRAPPPSRSALSLFSVFGTRARGQGESRETLSQQQPNMTQPNNSAASIWNPFDDAHSIPDIPELPDNMSDSEMTDLESGLRTPAPTLNRISTARSFRSVRSVRSARSQRSVRSNRSYRTDASGNTIVSGTAPNTEFSSSTDVVGSNSRASNWSTRSRSLVFMLTPSSMRKSSPRNSNRDVEMGEDDDPFEKDARASQAGSEKSSGKGLGRLNAWLQDNRSREKPLEDSAAQEEKEKQENEGVRNNMVSKLRAAAMRRKGY